MGLFGRKKEAEVAEHKPHPLVAALKEGGLTAERALDVLQGQLGSEFRAGGGKAIETFCEFYDITCDIGNADSVKRYTARFLPLLPKADRLVVEHRCGLDGSDGSKAAQMFKKQQEAYKNLADLLAPAMHDAFEEELEKIRERMRRGGPSARQEYLEIYERFAKSDDEAGLQKAQREYLPLLPRADRDEILRLMLRSYRDSPEFIKMTQGMSEGEQLRLMESIVMDD
jgi:hypothetical protein